MATNEITKQKVKELLSSDEVVNAVMANLHFTVNDDMFNGCTLVAEIERPGHSPHMQLQVRLTRSQHNYFTNYHNKSPKFLIDKELNLNQKSIK